MFLIGLSHLNSSRILKILILISVLLGIKNINNEGARQKEIYKELMPIAWYPSRWQEWCMPEDEKKNR